MKAKSPVAHSDGHSKAGTGELSGIRWVDRYRGSSSLKDLRGSFRDRAEAFVDALRAAGATVTISATHRPPQRAYLMHWAWLIVKRNLDPAMVPAMDGVDISWTGMLSIADADGNIIEIRTSPRSGLNVQLRRVGESYGVIKYNRAGRDDPHWSDNGA